MPDGPEGQPAAAPTSPPAGGSSEKAQHGNEGSGAAAGAAAASKPETALRAEAGRYRTARNASLKREAALRAALEAHGVDPDGALQRSDISGLSIKDGEVEGDVTYTPPTFPSATTGATGKPAAAGPAAGLTMDDVRKMDRHQILERYDEVQAVYRAHAKSMKPAVRSRL